MTTLSYSTTHFPNGREASPYQQEVFSAALHGDGDLVVKATAGSGKSTTLKQVARLLQQRAPGDQIGYFAFSKAIADEMRPEMPQGVTVDTIHGQGYKVVQANLGPCRLEQYKYSNPIRDMLAEERLYPKRSKAYAEVSDAIRALVDMTRVKLIEPRPNGTFSLDDIEAVAEARGIEIPKAYDGVVKSIVAEILYKGLEEAREKNLVDFTDMLWLPHVLDLKPKHPYDVVLCDEAQDLNRAQLELVMKLSRAGGRRIFVGDEFQCVVAGTKIATSAGEVNVEDLREGDEVIAGHGRGIARASAVTDIYVKPLANAPVVTVTTESGKKLTTTPEHIYFAGFEPGGPEHFYTYLMYRKDLGYRIGTTQTYRRTSGARASGLSVRLGQETGDAIWVLRTCKTMRESRFWESLLSAKYGLPTITFNAPVAACSTMPQEDINTIFAEIDTRERVKRLIQDEAIDLGYPHHRPKCMSKTRRRNLSIKLCADPRGQRILHTIEMSGSDQEDAKALNTIGIKVESVTKTSGWRYRKYSNSMAELHEIARRVAKVVSVEYVESAILAKGVGLPHCPASHVREGMHVFVTDESGSIKAEVVTAVEKSLYTGNVYDLNVKDVHNFVGNGIVTHNCIYGFAGAESDSIDQIIKRTRAEVLPLSITYRCPASHVALARQISPGIEAAPGAAEGETGTKTDAEFYQQARPGDMVMCRTTRPLVAACFEMLRAGKPAVIRGRDIGADLIKLAKKIAEGVPRYGVEPMLAAIQTHFAAKEAEFMRRAKNEDEAAQKIDALRDRLDVLTLFVEETPDARSVDDVAAKITRLFDDRPGGAVVFTTMHRAKGLEADTTWILQPELMPHPMAKTPAEKQSELFVEFVALTRAKSQMWFVGEYRRLPAPGKVLN